MLDMKTALDILQPQGIDESNIADYTGKEATTANWEPYASDVDGATDEGQQVGALIMAEAERVLNEAAEDAKSNFDR